MSGHFVPACNRAMASSVRRVLLVRLDGLGDALACIPALEGLRREYPDASFGAVCSPSNAALFSRLRTERVHIYDGRDSEAALVAELRALKYTDALIATEEPAGYRLARESGAVRRAGFWHRFEKTFKSLWQYAQVTDAVYRAAAWVAQPEHEVVAMYRLAERLGARPPIPDDAFALRVWIDASPEGAIPNGRSALGWQIAPKLTSGGWGPDALAALAAAAHAASPFERIVFLCAPRDQGLARSVMEHLPHGFVAAGNAVLAPPADLPQWLGAIASAGALVTPDTGAAHAAGMLGVPVVDLFDPARFEQLSRQWRPWAAPSCCIIKPQFMNDADAADLGALVGAALAELSESAGVAPRVTP